ncbi:hypothetical protein [Hymenobacter guriensis]|uniref:Uncharacterized protein n=1 Tax=Hymenobacter guriensis TaxID=2793065 RepID=A0ABS0KXJ9_9BACT|nr:hypothetical protein [Hymenobacter guriensis]MBG8552581.1 hypothetical protein [Hymenobacter guriensis]
MKKIVLLLAFAAFSGSAFAQEEIKTQTQNPATGAQSTTEVDVRDNGTVKVESEARTGRTKAGQKAYNTGQDVKRAGRKTGHVAKRGAQKTGKGLKKAGKAVKNTAKDVVD